MQSTQDEIVLELLDVLYPWGAAGAGKLPRRRRREGSKGGHGCVPSSRAADGPQRACGSTQTKGSSKENR